MQTFDAAGATAHYLQMIDPAREAQAIAYTHGTHWIMLWGWLLTVGIDVMLLRSRLLVGLRDRIQRGRPRPKLTAFVSIAVFIGVTSIVSMPWSFYVNWIREHSYGLSNQTLSDWLVQYLISTLVTALLLGLAAIAIYALIRRSGDRWWAWSGLVVAVLAVFAIVVMPVLLGGVLNQVRPAPAGPIRIGVEQLAHMAGIPAERIVVIDASKRSNAYFATVVGGPGFATIELSDTMLQGKVDLSQVRAVVAHEIGHYVHNHLLILSIFLAMIVTADLWLVHRVLRLPRLNRHRQTPMIQDPSAIPLAHLVFATVLLLATPLLLSGQRLIEQDADRYGLRLANEPDGAAKALIRTVEYRASSPAPIEEALFYDHPSIAARVRRAMEWKRQHRVETSHHALR